MRRVAAFAIAVLVVSTAAELRAESLTDDQSEGPNNIFSVTLSTLNLAKPALSGETVDYGPEFEVMGEGRLAESFGLAGVLAYNHATGKNLSEPYDIRMFRVGLQGLWYAVGTFDRGLQLGLQTTYLNAAVDTEIDGVAVRAAGDGIAGSGLIGYKAVVDPGFTVDVQGGGGVQYLFSTGEAEAGGVSAEAERSRVAPKIVVNLNLGWTF